MGIPACLWRRTGEIYKGNKEFASLVNVPIETLREVRYGVYPCTLGFASADSLSTTGTALYLWANGGGCNGELLGGNTQHRLFFPWSPKMVVVLIFSWSIEIRQHCIRFWSKGCVDVLSSQESRSFYSIIIYILLLFIYDSKGQIQYTGRCW